MKQAIVEISRELSTIDQPLYAFVPEESEESFFIGESAIVAAAAILLKVFLEGLIESLKGKFKEWGIKSGEHIGEKIEHIFVNKDENIINYEEKIINENIQEVKLLIRKSKKKSIDVNINEIEKSIESMFIERGILQKRAEELANAIKHQVINIINENG